MDNRVAQAVKNLLNALVDVWGKLVDLQTTTAELKRDQARNGYDIVSDMELDSVTTANVNNALDVRSALDELAIAALGLKYALNDWLKSAFSS